MTGLQAASLVSLDCEGDGKDIRSGVGYTTGVSVAYAWSPGMLVSQYFPFRHRYGFNYDERMLSGLGAALNGKTIVGHNLGKFDTLALGQLGLPLKDAPFYDTLQMAHLLNENLPGYGLDAVSAKWLGPGHEKQKSDYMDKVIKAMGWGAVPSEVMAPYAATDAGLPLMIHAAMQPQWAAEGLDEHWWVHKVKSIRTVRDMEVRGVLIDQDYCAQQIERGEAILADLTRKLGGAPAGKYLEDLLLNQLRLPVVSRTPKGKPCFDKRAMAAYEPLLARQGSRVAGQILRYRGWQKTVSTNYRAYLNLMGPDGRVRPEYKLHGTQTGRLSCSSPNLQNIPRESTAEWNGGTKRAFIGKPGYMLMGFDYKQLEYRIAAGYSQEPRLLEVLSDPNRDAFTEMAADLGMERHEAKTMNYSIAYGAGVNRIMEAFGVSHSEAKRRIDTYYRTYPGLKGVASVAARSCEKNGKIKLWSGRYRHFDRPHQDSYKAFNSACQGGAADIVEDRMNALDEALRGNEECQLLLQVHDELIFEIQTDKYDTYEPMIKSIMRDVPGRHIWGGLEFGVDNKKVS